MKNKFTFILMLSAQVACAQWSTLNTPATDNLNDVDFINSQYGVITGNGGTLLLTDNGGVTWSDISGAMSMQDIYGVKVFNEDTIMVSTYDINTASGTIYITMNAGASWVPAGTDAGMNHEIVLESVVPGTVWALGSNLYHTNDFGAGWDTSVFNTAGTSSYDAITFADGQTAHISGLVSGFTTYSAVFSRTDNGGISWFPGDVFSFPNDDAYTAMCFINGDTAMYFMNEYAGFMPSAINKLIKIHSFNKVSPFPGDTLFTFTSEEVNAAMPAYINDAFYLSSVNGIALGEDGNVYRTADGGITWNIDYTVPVSLKKLEVIDTVIYAVGSNGTVIKYGTASVVDEVSPAGVTVYPNPTGDMLYIVSPSTSFTAGIYTADGRLIEVFEAGRRACSVSHLRPGVYLLELRYEDGLLLRSRWVRQ